MKKNTREMIVGVLALSLAFMVFSCPGGDPVEPDPDPGPYTITVENGNIFGQRNEERKYEHNTEIRLVANAAEINYRFVSWEMDGIVQSTDSTYIFHAARDGHYIATYEIIDPDWRPEPGEPGYASRTDLYRFYDDFSTGDAENPDMLDSTKWGYDEGGGGFGNQELQFYHRDNIRIVDCDEIPGNRKVVITMRKEQRSNSGLGEPGTNSREYTSGKFWAREGTTMGGPAGGPGFSSTYGKIEAKIRVFNKLINAGYTQREMQGLWPAFWMMPRTNTYPGGWPFNGEIDIMEIRGRFPGQMNATIHRRPTATGGETWVTMTSAGRSPGLSYSTTATSGFANDYMYPDSGSGALTAFTCGDWRVYCVEWEYLEETDTITFRYYVDDILFYTITEDRWRAFDNTGTELTKPAPFNHNFYPIFNLAIGGNFDNHRVPSGPPAASGQPWATPTGTANNLPPDDAAIFLPGAPPIEYEIDWIVWRDIVPRSGEPGEVQKPIY